jgi:predicted hydrocarbon binding protein
MIKTASTYYFPNRLGRIMLLAFEEVLGRSGLNALLNLSSLSYFIDNFPPDNDDKAIPFETISQLHYALEQGYGPHGGRGLALRAGRVFFSAGLRTYSQKLGFRDATFRLQPLDSKLSSALNSLMNFLNQHSDQGITLEETEYNFLWRIENCPWCWGRHEYEPVCHFVVGMLQEALFWVSGGKFYNVVEKTCIAQGDTVCLVEIDCVPLA